MGLAGSLHWTFWKSSIKSLRVMLVTADIRSLFFGPLSVGSSGLDQRYRVVNYDWPNSFGWVCHQGKSRFKAVW